MSHSHRLDAWDVLLRKLPAAFQYTRICGDLRSDGLCLTDLLVNQSRLRPDDTAIVGEQGSLSFSELVAASFWTAVYLEELGCRADECVGLFVEHSLEQMIGAWGILFAGGAYLPLSVDYPVERLKYMLDDARVKLIFTQSKFENKLKELVSPSTQLITIERIAEFLSKREAPPSRMPLAQVNDRGLAYVVYTSGSSGQPKGVMIEHRSIVNQMLWLSDACKLNADKTLIQKTPISFDAAQWEMLAPCCGTKVVLGSTGINFRVNDLIASIQKNSVTTLQCVPTLLQALVNKPEFATCTSLTHVLSGGESLTRKLVQQCFDALPNAMIVNLYGPSECTCNASFYEAMPKNIRVDEASAIPIGTPVDNTQFYILNEQGVPVVGNEIGEICVSGSQVARGYLNRAELTEERFVEYPVGRNSALARLYKTGDLGYQDDRGIYYFSGRSDTQVKIKGMRIELEEVKITLESLDFIDSAAVLVVEGNGGRKYLAACLQIKCDAETHGAADEEVVQSVRDGLSQVLPDYMIPSVFVITRSMPHTVTGKIDLRKVLELVKAHGTDDHVAPRNATEDDILAIWKLAFSTSRISVRDDFFALGGDSMAAVDLILSINDRFNCELPLHIIFKAPTIEALASLVNKGLSGESSRVVCLQPKGPSLPIFCWPGLGGYPLNLRLLAEDLPHTRPFYSIQAHGINEGEIPYDSLKEMVAADIAEIRKIQGTGPYHLWGYSFGTNLAFEAAYQLEQAGEKVERLVLLAPGMLKGLRTDDSSGDYSNSQLIALLFTVFARNTNDPDLHACLELATDEESFADFISKKFSISSRDLVKRICQVVIKSRQISQERSREASKVVRAETLMYCARNDELSVLEMNPHYFSGSLEIVHVNTTHFDFLMAPDVENLAALIKERLN